LPSIRSWDEAEEVDGDINPMFRVVSRPSPLFGGCS